jgi:hypothetical protein
MALRAAAEPERSAKNTTISHHVMGNRDCRESQKYSSVVHFILETLRERKSGRLRIANAIY